MSRVQRWSRWFGVGMILALTACSSGKEKEAEEAPAGPPCLSTLDCAAGQVCESQVCVKAPERPPQEENNGGVVFDPDNNGTNNGTNNHDANNSNDPPCTPQEEVCDGADNDCDGDVDEGVTNACGGCGELTGAEGDPCGECDSGQLACGADGTLVCQGETPRNACGGCDALSDDLDTPCGDCGSLKCDGENALKCEDTGLNACNGCRVLDMAPGDECGFCGTAVCDNNGGITCDDPGEAACSVTRFIAMGDTGEASEAQYRVARGAQARCDRAGGCDGFIMLGDNIYDEGAQSPTDSQLRDKIDLPYAEMKKGAPPAEGEDNRERLPIYVSLGNHDLGGAGLNSFQVAHYMEYARQNDWFYYPDEWFDVKVGLVHLVSVHTNPLAYLGTTMEPQGAMVDRVAANTDATWTLAFGHHPYRSNGRHGNAGSYEGIPGDFVVSGGKFREWIDAHVCNQIDFYLSGHDHNRQWISQVPDIPSWPLDATNRQPCNTEFAVSGAGAKTTDFEDFRFNDLDFGSEEIGFLFMEFRHDRVVVEFCDADGDTEWTRTIMR